MNPNMVQKRGGTNCRKIEASYKVNANEHKSLVSKTDE